jgi:hypothetical protein
MKRILFVTSTLALFFTALQANASIDIALQMQLGNPSNATASDQGSQSLRACSLFPLWSCT